MTLHETLTAILSGTIALGPLVFVLFEYFEIGRGMDPRYKRVFVAAVSGLSGAAVWAIAVMLGYVASPATNAEIAEAIWAKGVLTGFSTFTASTIIHGLVVTKRKPCASCPLGNCADCPVSQVS